MRHWIAVCFAVLMASSAQADELELGCYQRIYSDAHLAKHPAQIVQAIQLKVYNSQYNTVWGDLRVRFADQGRVRGTRSAGALLKQSLICFTDGGPGTCQVECDGGRFDVVKQTSSSMTFETRGLMVGSLEDEGCGGSEDLAEFIGQPVRYRLNRVADAVCDGL